jgi:predicted RNA-binding protein with PIN domain
MVSAGSRCDHADMDDVEPRSLLIVDGFNVLHAAVLRGRARRGWRGPEARGRLLTAVASAVAPSHGDVLVVFDDASPAPAHGGPGPMVVHAPDADEWIVARVRSDPTPARITVATADRPLGDRARTAGATILGPHALLGRSR